MSNYLTAEQLRHMLRNVGSNNRIIIDTCNGRSLQAHSVYIASQQRKVLISTSDAVNFEQAGDYLGCSRERVRLYRDLGYLPDELTWKDITEFVLPSRDDVAERMELRREDKRRARHIRQSQ